MVASFNDILFAFSDGLDQVEHELIGVTTGHGKRVACIAVLLGRAMGLDEATLLELAACGVLHDCALAEYIRTEYQKGDTLKIAVHCKIGETYVAPLPFSGDVTGVILYHHENADGTGALGKVAAETPLLAQLVHFADILDAECNLRAYETGKFEKIQAYLMQRKDGIFDKQLVDCFLETITAEDLQTMQGDGVDAFIEALPRRMIPHAETTLRPIAQLFAKIIDYKSSFTRRHSLDIADKAYQMAKYYGYDAETCEKLYFAGAVHDIGKLIVDTDILEKPGRLDRGEYEHVKTHAWQSYHMLSKIEGMEDITRWAALHHEKLDGSGYPFGLTADRLDKKERLMACLDIYQALTEPRPYKEGMTHQKTMGILKDMAQQGQLDGSIVADLDAVFAP